MADFKIGLDFSDGRLIEVLEKAFGAADRLDKKVDELQGQLNKGFPSGNAAKLSAEIDKTAKGAGAGAASMRQFGQSAGLAFGAFQLGIGIVQGVGQGIAKFATNTISLAGAAETAEPNFTTFLGSASAAKDVLRDLNKFAADTPFTQTQINGVAQSLIAFGVEAENLKPTLQTLGDLSGGNAEKFGDLARIFGQAKTTTKVYTEDLNQLAERGIPVLQELAKQNNTTEEAVRKLASEGKIGFGDLEKAFASLTSEGGKFYGLMARQSQTFEGLRSTLQGNFEQLQASVGQLLLPTLKQLVISTNEVISAVDTSNFKDIGQDLAVSFQQFGDTFDPVIEAIKSGFGGDILPALVRFRDAVEDVIVDVSGFFSTLNEGGAPAAFITAVIETLSNAFAALVDSVSFAVEAIGNIAGPIINALAPAFREVVKAGTAVLETINSLSGAAPEAGGAFKGLGDILGGVASAIGFVVQLFAEAVKGIVGASDAMKSANPIIRGFGEVVDFLAAPWRTLARLIADGAAALADFLGLTEGEGEKQARIAQENAARIQQGVVDQRDAYEAERDLRNENTAGEKKAVEEKRKVQAAASAEAKKEREKAAKEAQKLEEDRAALQLALITDQTQREIEAEKARFEAQKKEIGRLFPLQADSDRLIELAKIQHSQNLADIAQGAADEQAKILEDQAKLRLSIIGDETGKAVAVEEARYKEQRAALIESFAGTEELNGLIEQAEAQHQANIDKIQFDAAAKRIADGAGTQKELAEAQVKLLEETQARYILELEKGGASEEEIATAKEAFQLASQKLRLQNEIAYQQAILAAVATGDDAQRAEIEAQIAVLQAQLGNVDFQINAPDNLGDGLLDKIKNLKENIAKALNIPPGEFDKLVSGAVDAVGNAFNAFNAISAITDAQIATNQAVIDSLNERITAQQEAVDKEKESAEQGYANDLSIEQARLDGLLQQREEAETKARQLREKALRLQLLQDTAQQVSNTAVSVTNIIKNTSTIPFVGILLAAIQIGSLFALLSASRQKAKAEAASTKFFRGGKIPMFRTDENGMEGNRIEGTNIEVGGNEFVVNRKVTNEHEQFLTRLNAGEYAGRDLEKEVGERSGSQPDKNVRPENQPVNQPTKNVPMVGGKAGASGAAGLAGANGKQSRPNIFVRSETFGGTDTRPDIAESKESRFERWATERFNEVVYERTNRERIAKNQFLETNKLTTDTLRSDVSRIATEAVTSQVMERVLSSAMSDTERHFFEQIGMAQPAANQAHNFVQMVEGAQMYPVHVPGTPGASFREYINAAPTVIDLADRFILRTREATETVSGMVTASRDDQSGKIVAAVTQQTNDLIRRGLLPLMQLGHRIVDAEGNTVHYSTDAAGNTRVSKLVS